MKILLVNNIGIDYGGAEVLVRQLKEGLQAEGHDVRVLAGDVPDSPQRFSDYTFRSFETNSIARFFLLIFNPFAVWSLYKVLKTFKPDVVHLHIISNASPFILLPLKNIPTVFTIHYHMVFDPTRIEDTPNLKAYENELRYFFINDKRKLRYYGEKLKFFFFRRYYKNIDIVIAYSDFFAEAARDSKLFNKVVVVRNGIKLLPFAPIKNKKNLLYLGRMDQVKGVDTLLEAMPEVIKQIPDATLTLAGDGPYMNFCKTLSKTLSIDNNVNFLGYRNYEDVAELLRESTIVVVPSIWPEAFGLVNVEAMSVGRPVVACRVGGIPEIIKDGKTGLLIEPSDPKALADALIKLLKNPSLCIEFGMAGRKRVETEFSPEAYVSNTLGVYKELVKNDEISANSIAGSMKKIYYGLQNRILIFRRDLKWIPKIFNGKPLLSYSGWIGYGNLGDELLFIAHQKLFPGYEIIPYHRKSLLGVFTRLNKRRFKACILGGGTLINLPGVYLEDTYSMLGLNLPIFALGTGVNFKFKDDREEVVVGSSIKNWIGALDRFSYVGVRGPLSAKILNPYLKKSVEIIGDTALSLAPETPPHISKQNIIGICVGDSREIPSGVDVKKYIQVLGTFIKTYLNRGFEVVILPVYRNDENFNEELLKEVDSKRCILLKFYDDYEKYLSEVAKCTFFIGQKLHGTVIATMLRVPSIMISYDTKCLDYMESIGMEDQTIDIQKISADILEEKFSYLLETQAEIRSRLNKNILRYRTAQWQKARQLEEQLMK